MHQHATHKGNFMYVLQVYCMMEVKRCSSANGRTFLAPSRSWSSVRFGGCFWKQKSSKSSSQKMEDAEDWQVVKWSVGFTHTWVAAIVVYARCGLAAPLLTNGIYWKLRKAEQKWDPVFSKIFVFNLCLPEATIKVRPTTVNSEYNLLTNPILLFHIIKMIMYQLSWTAKWVNSWS